MSQPTETKYTRYYRNKGRARKEHGQAFLAAYKLKMGCLQCGYRDHPDALEFHHPEHMRGQRSPSIMIYGNIYTLMYAAVGCDVLCSNCHAIESNRQRRA